MSEIIVVTSGKGGVGKTTVTANLGLGLAKMNKKVVVVDTDIGLRNLDVVLGLENRIVYNLIDVIEGSCRMKQALIRDKQCDTLYLLPSAQTKDKTAITPEQMVKLTEDLSEEFDYILLDCPAGNSLIAGENSDLAHAAALAELLKGKPCHVNLIRLNAVKERHLRAADERMAQAFLQELLSRGISATLRRSMGSDIGGACGQLRAKYLGAADAGLPKNCEADFVEEEPQA